MGTTAGEVCSAHRPADSDLETGKRPIRRNQHHGSGLEDVDLSVPASAAQVYKEQMLFSEACCNRAFDIDVDGQRILDQFNTLTEQGGSTNIHGSVITTYFEATSATADIRLSNDVVNGIDDNPTLSGFTFEAL